MGLEDRQKNGTVWIQNLDTHQPSAESLRPQLPNMKELEGPLGTTQVVRRMRLPAFKDKGKDDLV